MANDAPYPNVKVAVALIQRDGRFLTVYNPKWMAFTFAMTKLREWSDPETPPIKREESWDFAAARAAAEVLGRTITDLTFAFDYPEYRQSDREGVVRRYRFQVFSTAAKKDNALVPGTVFEWLTAEEILDKKRMPISPTAQELIRQLGGAHDPNPMLKKKT